MRLINTMRLIAKVRLTTRVYGIIFVSCLGGGSFFIWLDHSGSQPFIYTYNGMMVGGISTIIQR